ncbi:MAG: hypothetical protein J6T60_15545 [Bacteroidales bacterium]|nr:hypothetical protein [Bacteroidales bacterium]
MKKLFYIISILIAAVCVQSCGKPMDGVWTCKKVTIVGKNYDDLPDFTKDGLDALIGATMTFKDSVIVEKHNSYGCIAMAQGYFHFSDDQKVLTISYKKESDDGGATWEDVFTALPTVFDYRIVSLTANELIFQSDKAGGITFEYTYEKK